MIEAYFLAITLPAVWIAFALQAADVVTTLIVLRGPRGVEKNPVVAKLMAVLGHAWPVAKVGVAGAGVIAFAASPWPWMVWVLNAAMAWVVWHNIGTIRRQHRKQHRG